MQSARTYARNMESLSRSYSCLEKAIILHILSAYL